MLELIIFAGLAAIVLYQLYSVLGRRKGLQPEDRAAVETAFGVKVLAVRTMVVRGKMKRMGRGYAKTQNWKKAIVTLRQGDKIAAFEAQ